MTDAWTPTWSGSGDEHGYHVGRRHLDPRHERGQWWVDRHDELPADQQGTGRPWRGARDNLQKGQK